MAQVHFHCSDSVGRLLDRRIADVDDLLEAHDYAEAVARSLIASADLQDWRTCRLRVWDELGEEVLVMPFSSIVGKPH
jgi:Domain of unknown function (DUF6894)